MNDIGITFVKKEMLMTSGPVKSAYLLPFRGLLKITRIWNLLIIVLAQYFTAVFLASGNREFLQIVSSRPLFLLSLSSILVAAAGYIINDYYDVKIDLINKPKRVVVGKVLKRRVAMFMHIILSGCGILTGVLVSWKIGLVNLLCVGMLWLYSNQLKRLALIGNLVVSLLTGISIYVVHLIFPDGHTMVLGYALFAFCFTLIREIIKDMEDLKGDATFGCRTLPVVYGIRKTKWFIYFVSVSFIITVILLSFFFVGTRLSIFCISLIVPFSYLTYRLSRADTVKEFGFLSQYCKVVMLLGILSMCLFYN